MISLSYSRISLADIAEKLSLESTQDAEYIVAKAIRDGVIEAVINHEEGYVQSRVSGECVWCVCVCSASVCVHACVGESTSGSTARDVPSQPRHRRQPTSTPPESPRMPSTKESSSA